MTGDGVAACVRAGARACVLDCVHGYARLQHIIDQHTLALPYIIDYTGMYTSIHQLIRH